MAQAADAKTDASAQVGVPKLERSPSGSRPRSRSSPVKYGWPAPASPPISRAARSMRGLDLSEVNDLTALVLIGRDHMTGIWSVKPTFWLPEQGLAERASLRDRQGRGL